MQKYLYVFFILVLSTGFIVNNVTAQSNYPDIKIIQNDHQALVFEWRLQDLSLQELNTNNMTYVIPSFSYSDNIFKSGAADLPWRTIILGIPKEEIKSVQVLNVETKIYSNISIAPIPNVYKDKKQVTNYDYNIQDEIYNQSILQAGKIYQLGKPDKFRDFYIQNMMLSPFDYDPASRSLKVRTSIRVQVNYAKSSLNNPFKERGKLDGYLKDLLLNFDTAKNWQQPRAGLRKSAKLTNLPSGIYYRIPVTEDGLYKISASAVNDAGVSLDNINLDAIQMFNNGGHILAYKVNAEHYNPPQTMEIPVFISDQNNNGRFDGSDYILFYGKALNSRFYNYSNLSFEYQKHPYATVNYYLLSLTGINGKRMAVEPLDEIPGTSEAEYSQQYYHFEEDKYNLLSSGPDWYGYRFFGLTGSYSKTFTLNNYNSAYSNPVIRVRLKGGSDLVYDPSDDNTYLYYFTISLNNKIIQPRSVFSNSSTKLYTITLDPSELLDGQNILNLQYEGGLEACAAYLDWVDIVYPGDFSAVNNYLNFYTKDLSAKSYRITNLSGNGFYVFDVTNPVEPVILVQDKNSQNGEISFDIPDGADHRNLITTTLNSSKIHNVESLQSIQKKQDLLTTNNSADFVIITHKSFTPYAEEIAELRDTLLTKVVTMEDIYFNFNNTVTDPTAIRNFIRYAYNNWQGRRLSYVLLFGDGSYDYRHIALSDTQRVPPFEIYASGEIDSRTTDEYYADLNFNGNNFDSISADIAIGRLPMESTLDAERMVEKLRNYKYNPARTGWQTNITMVGDDQNSGREHNEWVHQSQTESLADLDVLSKFIINKVYLSAYESVPGGFGEIKLKANRDLIDYINQGTLIVNYVGHGSPTQWAHESVFNMSRDLSRINNPGKLSFFVAATCDFGKYDDPLEPSFTEALIWKENSAAIGVLSSVRLVYSGDNAAFNQRFYNALFPVNGESRPLGAAKLMATKSKINDQKYHLFADPTMTLLDPRDRIRITSINPSDTLKALSQVEVSGEIIVDNRTNNSFDGGAVLIVNDARFDSVNTGGGLYYTLPGPTLFKGEVSVNEGILSGTFIVPKSIRFEKQNTGRISIFAWNKNNLTTALGYDDSLLFLGSTNIDDSDGPDIDIYFKDYEGFNDGDLIPGSPVMIASIEDKNGINMTGETGHNISLKIDDNNPEDVSGYFFYEKNSYTKGYINYPMDKLEPGTHTMTLTAFDNVNNLSEHTINFKVAASEGMVLMNVVNYPNPFHSRSEHTAFTFEYQTTNNSDAEVEIKIYTITGRLIQIIEGNYVSGTGYKEIEWDGRDRDGDHIANGVYLYKVILKDGSDKKEVIEKLMIMN